MWEWERSMQANHTLASSTGGSFPRPRLHQGPGQPSAASLKAVGTIHRDHLSAFLSYSPSHADYYAGFAGLESIMSTIETLFLYQTHIFERGKKKVSKANFYLHIGLSIPTEMYSAIPLMFLTKIIKDQAVFICSYRKEHSQFEFK